MARARGGVTMADLSMIFENSITTAAAPVTLASLATRPLWVAWQVEDRGGKPTKIPYSPDVRRGKAKPNDPNTWGARDLAQARADMLLKPRGVGGVGIQLADIGGGKRLGGVDLDSCRDPHTGEIEPWAETITDRLGGYVEVSPSGRGVKLFFAYDADILPDLRAAMGSHHGKQFKRSGDEHPPAMELYVSNRYFAVTDERIDGGTDEILDVSLADLRWIIKVAGPAFKGAPRGAEPESITASVVTGAPEGDLADRIAAASRDRRNAALRKRWKGDWSKLQDGSASGRAMALGAAIRRAGFSFAEMCEALHLHSDTAEWARSKGDASEQREFRRIWDRVDGKPPEGTANAEDGRTIIYVTSDNIEATVNNAEDALISGQRGVYQRGGMIVGVGSIPMGERGAGSLRIFERKDFALAEDLGCVAQWRGFHKETREFVPIDPPHWVVKTLQQRTGRLRLPALVGIITMPTLRADGSLLDQPGYDRRTGLLLHAGGVVLPTIPMDSSRADGMDALDMLKSLIETFSFVGEADRSVALSAVLTASVRRSLRTAPLHAFTAPVAGSGKSMLADVASMIATGREAAVIAQGKTDEETEKRLASLLLAGAGLVQIDNCELPLGGDLLCQMVTQETVSVRILGRSEVVEMPTNTTLMATGNNLVLLGDMTRRAILCRLDPGIERPELRTFHTNPMQQVREHRGELVRAALTVLRAFHNAGRPRQSNPLGSFEDWSLWVRDALIWLGESDPVGTMEFTRATDPKLEAMRSVIANWATTIGITPITARDLIEQATASDFDRMGRRTFRHPDFREALLVVAGRGGDVNSAALGGWLKANHGRIVDGHKIVRATTLSGNNRWMLSP